MSVLFTLQARPGEEYSSDSMDSDYYPGRESSDDDVEKLQKMRNHIRRRKRKNGNTSKSSAPKRKCRTTAQAVADNDTSNENKDDGVHFHLPPEVMVKIFRYGIEAVGFTNFIPSVARVSKEWNRVASDPSMLEKLDLSVSQVMLMKKNQALLTKILKRDISQCHKLNLHGQVLLGPSTIENIVNLTPRLKMLDLQGCNIKPEFVRQIPQLCPLIQRLNLSSQPGANRRSTIASLETMIKGLGANLVELRLSNINIIQQFPSQVLKIIQENCPNLEELDLGVAGLAPQSSQSFMYNMEDFTLGCPKLKEVRLDGFDIKNSLMIEKPHGSSLKHLQVYSQTMHLQYGRDLPAFYRLFSSGTKLKMLNVSHSRLQPSIISQWVKEIEELNLQDMRWADSEEREMILCLAKWSMSLKILDLSYNKPSGLIIDMALSQYGETEHPDGYPLQILNLSNSNVSARAVIHVIHACKNLKEINLTSCRDLPRGTKRNFKRREFRDLLKLLRPFVQENTVDLEDVLFILDSDED